METKADLHAHPHFFNPESHKRGIPNLQQVVDKISLSGLDICSISACHPAKGMFDRRFFEYMEQLGELEAEFDISYNRTYLHLRRKHPDNKPHEPAEIVILNSQEVRTLYQNRHADINVIGVKELLEPEEDIEETAKKSQDLGGIVLVSHPGSMCGAGLEKSVDLLDKGCVDGIEGYVGIEKKKINQKVMDYLASLQIKALAVGDAHHYSQFGIAYTMFMASLIENGSFLLQNLKKAIKEQQFNIHEGSIGAFSSFWHHERYILASIPVHIIRRPTYFMRSFLKR